MQFIYGSDGSSYGTVYTDDIATSERVFSQLGFNVDSTMDGFGFSGIGTNGNQPFFFRCSNDEKYSRSAYYVHGIYREAEEKYYKSETGFFNDLFLEFIEPDWMQAKRDGKVDAPNSKRDEALVEYYNNTKFDIKNDVLVYIIACILKEERIILSIPDELFSHYYARSLIKYIYKHLPYSIIKSCSFVSNVPSAASMRIRILSECDVPNTSGIVIPVCDNNYTPKRMMEYSDAAESLLRLCEMPDVYSEFTEGYRIMCKAYETNYKHSVFLAYWRAYEDGNKNAAKSILSSVYLNGNFNPDPDNIPEFISNLLKDELSVKLSGSSFDKLLSTDEILSSNSMALRELYVIDKDVAFVKAIDELYGGEGGFLTGTIKPDQIDKIREKIDQYYKADRNKIPEYHKAFYEVTDKWFSRLNDRIFECFELLKRVIEIQNDVKATLDTNYNKKYINEIIYNNLIKYFMEKYVNSYQNDAIRLCLDLKDTFNKLVVRTLDEHNTTYKPKIGDNGLTLEERERNVEYQQVFMNGLEANLSINSLLEAYNNAFVFYGPLSALTKECTRELIRYSRSFGKGEIGKMREAIREYSGINFSFVDFADEDFEHAILASARYRYFDDAIQCIVEIINKYPDKMNTMDKEHFEDFSNTVIVRNLVHTRITSSMDTAKEYIEYLKSELPSDLKGNTAQFAKLLKDIWLLNENQCRNKKVKKFVPREQYEHNSKNDRKALKRKVSTAPIILFSIIGVLIVALIVGVAILYTSENQLNGDSTETTGTSESNGLESEHDFDTFTTGENGTDNGESSESGDLTTDDLTKKVTTDNVSNFTEEPVSSVNVPE